MSQAIYRRKAILSRIHKALDAFYLLQKIDWEYDIRSTLEKILGLALEEVELEGGKQIERGLIIIQPPDGGNLEIQAGWKADDPDLTFSRTVVQQTISSGEPILCENAKDDPRFMGAESIKHLETLSLISVPLQFETQRIGALYIESSNLFNEGDLDFLKEFTDTIAPYLKTALTHQEPPEGDPAPPGRNQRQYRFSSIIGRRPWKTCSTSSESPPRWTARSITGESGCGKGSRAPSLQRPGKATRSGRGRSSLEHSRERTLQYHKGAFTGASADKTGRSRGERRHHLLDEISDTSKPLRRSCDACSRKRDPPRGREPSARSTCA